MSRRFRGRHFLHLLAAVAVAAGPVSGCGPEVPPEPPPAAAPGPEDPAVAAPRLVLLYAPCTVNARHLSPYSAEIDFTPNLARLAAEGVVFRRQMTEAGQSGTAYAAMFSGQQAPGHGVFAHPTRIAPEVELAAEAFRDAGWDTYFWGGHPLAGAEYGYGQGVSPGNTRDFGLQAGDPLFREMLGRLAADPDARAFIQTHFTVTHAPYDPRALDFFRARHPGRTGALEPRLRPLDDYLGLYRKNVVRLSNDFPGTVEALGLTEAEVQELAAVVGVLYDANIHLLDDRFGRVVQEVFAAGLLEESLIVFTADHGETLFPPGVLFPWTHGWELAPEVLTVPCIVRLPGAARAGMSYDAVTRSTDLAPTLAGLAGVPWPGASGRNLARAVAGAEPPPRLRAYSHTTLFAERFADRVRNSPQWMKYHAGAFRDEMWVAVRDGDTFHRRRRGPDGEWVTERYDLAEDPDARQSRFDPGRPEDADAEERLLAYQRDLVQAAAAAGGGPSVDDAAEERLRALGYVE